MSLMEKLAKLMEPSNADSEKELIVVMIIFGLFLLVQAVVPWFQYRIIS